jgi:hypothetical protein
VTSTVASMNSTISTEVITVLQHIAEALECVAATLPPERRATVEKHTLELRRVKAGLMAELV